MRASRCQLLPTAATSLRGNRDADTQLDTRSSGPQSSTYLGPLSALNYSELAARPIKMLSRTTCRILENQGCRV
jgi:hypothetical protein